ncbi:MAG: ACR3 family arsenite efflux transporter [Bacteroidetes bacterium]|jgi:ACR3 family arsenite transporter|nr:ACR3 family arsenite efflux transporter [Bacteroidota bacterium]
MANSNLGPFERYLSLWVALSIVLGVGLGAVFGTSIKPLANWEIAHVNIPVMLLVWLMVYPMMVQIDFGSLRKAGTSLRGLGLTVVVNWAVKPFAMAFFAWLFFSKLYGAFIQPSEAKEYIAGAILLGAAPCTAMVFVWSYLSGGNPTYTLIQVAANDIILLIAFIPIVKLLLDISHITIPYEVLFTSVVAFVAIPLLAGYFSNRWLIAQKGESWFTAIFLPRLKPLSMVALLGTLVLLFAFQGERILEQPILILLIAIPLTIQTYVIFFLSWLGGRVLKLPYTTCAPASMIGASNFFELAVAVAIVLFGLESGAALVTVVGVLIEVPIMLSLVSLAKRWRY